MDAERAAAATMPAADRRQAWVTTRERGSIRLLQIMTFISLRLGRAATRCLLHAIAAYFFVFAPTARRWALQYLQRALQRKPGAADRYRLILSFATTIHDRLYLVRSRYELFDISIEGEELVSDCHERAAGAFLLGAHMGSFEAVRFIGCCKPGIAVSMAMYSDNAKRISSTLAVLNPDVEPDIISLGSIDSMLQIRSRLDAGGFVGVLGDRTPGDEPCEIIEFLGSPACFPSGAMRAAALLRRRVFFMAGLYRGGNRYHVVFEELADFSTTPANERDAAVRGAIHRYAATLEGHCRADPYNWFNFFDFWRLPVAALGAAPR
ncbi:MAG: acyl-CoA synthetase [Steroidobacteraceae bacterium]